MQENTTASPTPKQTQKSSKANEKGFSLFTLFKFAVGVDIFLMVFGSICAIANGLAQPVMALLFGGVVDTFSTADYQHMPQDILRVSIKLLYLAAGAGIAAQIQVSCWTITGERQASRLQGLYFETLLRQEIGYFDTEMTVGQALGMASSDAITIQDAMSAEVVILEKKIDIIIFKFLHKASSLTAENEAITKYAKKLEKVNVFSARQGLVSGLGLGIVSFILFGGYGLTIWYGSKLILEKGYTGEQVISIIVALVYGGMALLQSSSCLNALSSGKAAASNMFKTIKRKPKINAFYSTGIVLENITGEIHLKDVYYRYPARQAVEVFSGLSLHISSGKHVALVGKSGCGKSTAISLLERFYDPDVGEVLIDGVSVKRLQLRWLREKIGLVSQEPVLFATTIRENIAYGKENATEDEINKALQSSSAATFIKDLPLLRIAIARIILKDPTVFLLDQITSTLDTKTEKAIYDEIFKIASRRTAIIITHSLSSVENVDSIAVMHQGKIVEQGTHAELIRNQDGHYSKLVSSQGKNQVENSKRMNGETRKYITETMENFEGLLSSTESITRESLSSDRVLIFMSRSSRTCELIFGPEVEKTMRRTRKETKQLREEQSSVASQGLNPEVESTNLRGDYSSDSDQEKVTMANARTLRELAAPDLNQQPLCITFPHLNDNTSFELKSGLIHLLPSFHGLSGEEPYKHLQEFDVVCNSMKPPKITEKQIKMRVFPFSLKDFVKGWLYYLPPGSITMWDQLKKIFLDKYFSASRAASLRKEICGIKQHPGKSLYEYWRGLKSCTSNGLSIR
ncbi:ABC transporter B family member 9-like [Coffea eugenioides]|uniref:ABC transporter B family member 9-like n=1 Tax=Coffea eugenioides TaxID=49369 RepID=UPI000F60D633|nr:ABC transporter B family member 9-like [Coffea eugenioides]